MKDEFIFFVGEQYDDAIKAVKRYFYEMLNEEQDKVIFIRKGDVDEIAEDIVQEIFLMKGIDA